jgi:hypothetical protein
VSERLRLWLAWFMVGLLAGFIGTLGILILVRAQTTSLHYAPNNDMSATYADGFNLADVSSKSAVDALPNDVRGLVWVGTCSGATSTFKSQINSYIGDSKVFAFYLMDEPVPSQCKGGNLKAETDYVHQVMNVRTFIILDVLTATSSPSYGTQYDGVVDLFGLDPYPCRVNTGCHYKWIGKAVSAAEADGYPAASLVPVYQAFGGGNYISDTGDKYLLPSATQEVDIINTWASLLSTPVFDYAYSWGTQNSDHAIADTPYLQTVFANHNAH